MGNILGTAASSADTSTPEQVAAPPTPATPPKKKGPTTVVVKPFGFAPGHSLGPPGAAESPVSGTTSPVKTTSGSVEHLPSERAVRALVREFSTNLTDEVWKSLSGLRFGIAGPISAGKTTLGRAIQVCAERTSGVACYFAPEHVDTKALRLYLENQPPGPTPQTPYNYAFYDCEAARQPTPPAIRNNNGIAACFQIDMLSACQDRMQQADLVVKLCRSAGQAAFAIVDRTPCDNRAFAMANHYLYGSISALQYQYYNEVVLKSFAPFGVDYLLFLDVSPTTTLERIMERGSAAEEKYQSMAAYLEYLHCLFFHSIVENFTVTARIPSFSRDGWTAGNEPTCALEDVDREVFPLVVVPWDQFQSQNVTSTLRSIAGVDGAPPVTLPRVAFVPIKATDATGERLEAPTFDFGPKRTNVEHRTWNWTREYASQTDAKKRTAFKQAVLDALHRGLNVTFVYEPVGRTRA